MKKQSADEKLQILKVALLLSLLVILFLFMSFVFLTPENAALADMVQKINIILSWPYNKLEELTGISMSWFLTAFCIFFFWFIVFYLVLLIFAFCAGRRKTDP